MKTTEPLIKTALIAAAVALPLAAHAQRVSFGIRLGVPAPVVVTAPPPPVYREVVYAQPGPGYIWLAGHYSWQGRWVWIRGAWVMPPQPGAYWIAGAYQGQNWVEGHWEVAQAAPPAPPGPPPPPTAGETIVTDDAPPPPMTETVVGVAPGPDYIWINGYWGWDHGRRIWMRGRWDHPPRHGAVWISPRWEHRGGHYVFVRGYWR